MIRYSTRQITLRLWRRAAPLYKSQQQQLQLQLQPWTRFAVAALTTAVSSNSSSMSTNGLPLPSDPKQVASSSSSGGGGGAMSMLQTHADIQRGLTFFSSLSSKELSSTKTKMKLKRTEYENQLYDRQIAIELEQQADAIKTHGESLKTLYELGRSTGLKTIQNKLLKWYEPFLAEISNETALIEQGVPGVDRACYGPYLFVLPADKLAIITLNAVFNSILRSGEPGVKLTQLALEIGSQCEAELNVDSIRRAGKDMLPWQRTLVTKGTAQLTATKMTKYNKLLRKILRKEEWDSTVQVKLGAALINLLMKSAKNEEGEAMIRFSSEYTNNPWERKKRVGYVTLHEEVLNEFDIANAVALPRYLPMLIPPKAWNNRAYNGAYYRLKVPLMKVMLPSQKKALQRAEMPTVLEALTYLGTIGWQINEPIRSVIARAWKEGYAIGDLPMSDDLPLPKEETCYRLPVDIIKSFMPTIRPSTAANAPKAKPLPGFIQRKIDELQTLNPDIPIFDDTLFRDTCRRITKKNSEMHSLRCDLRIKLSIAEKFTGEKIFFPHNLDFRGRAYPVPPNLSHLGSDLCRGLVTFHDAKPLGEEGFRWLKIHLANLFGYNKIDLDERVQWTEANMEHVLDSASSPLEGGRWWASAENPFQALATCFELANAIRSPDPHKYMCNLPVHQDGSCNGLQHYAGLGRDLPGGTAVNLVPSVRPQDVYSKVLEGVLKRIEEDISISPDEPDETKRVAGECARLVNGYVDRKVIKQTVMTSVYGVTRTGARAQVQARLEEKFVPDPTQIISVELDKQLFAAASYVSGLALSSLDQLFSNAKGIMSWLGQCARLVATQNQAMSWVTPLGLPVTQPYRQERRHTVRTVLQAVTLTSSNENLPVSTQKQKSAFPPNFVHSLDASHMLMTSLLMKTKGLTFAAVHDSYWTHACDVDTMNSSLRECFVELYQYPVLEDLRDSLTMRFPEVDFPPIPARGQLDINTVKSSTYFFH